jgi:hypothetical protein
MTEKQVLGLKPAPRLEQVGDEHSERVQDCKHRPDDAMILPHDANPSRIKFSERTGRKRVLIGSRCLPVSGMRFGLALPGRIMRNITNAAFLGAIGLEWQVMGFGNFSSLGETDMMLGAVVVRSPLPEYCEASGLRERAAHVANQQIEKKLLSLRQRKFLGGKVLNVLILSQ